MKTKNLHIEYEAPLAVCIENVEALCICTSPDAYNESFEDGNDNLLF